MDFVRSPRSASTFFSQVSFEWGLVISGFWIEAMESIGCLELATWLVSRSACWEMHSAKRTEWPVVEDVTLSFYRSILLVCLGYSCALHYCPLHYCLVNYWSFSFCVSPSTAFPISLAKWNDNSLLTPFSSVFLVWSLTVRDPNQTVSSSS